MKNSLGTSFKFINTTCPTIWGLPDTIFFKSISNNSVVFTLTDYNKSESLDLVIIQFLLNNYERLYFFPQGKGDLVYLRILLSRFSNINKSKITCLNRNISEYNELLKRGDLDYIGTRLHGGIQALHFGIPTLIISIDNRAMEISNDIGLPVLNREVLDEDKIRTAMANIYKGIQLNIPRKNIDMWFNSNLAIFQ